MFVCCVALHLNFLLSFVRTIKLILSYLTSGLETNSNHLSVTLHTRASRSLVKEGAAGEKEVVVKWVRERVHKDWGGGICGEDPCRNVGVNDSVIYYVLCRVHDE